MSVTTAPVARLDDQERAVLDHIAAAHRGILDMGLRSNQGELVAAVHVLQGFVLQRMAQRVDPQEWGSWYDLGDEAVDTLDSAP